MSRRSPAWLSCELVAQADVALPTGSAGKHATPRAEEKVCQLHKREPPHAQNFIKCGRSPERSEKRVPR